MPVNHRHPFQKLCYIQASSDAPETLLGASGPYLCCYDFQKGLVARWSVDEDEIDDIAADEAQHAKNGDNAERPAKRQRLSGNENSLLLRQESEESVEFISERVKGQRRKPKPQIKTPVPDISHLLATSHGSYVIVVTSDDKCIRVLERRKSGRLRCISERRMPKRLCAISLTKDEKTIITGDKFGDVYSLPLFPSADVVRNIPNTDQQGAIPEFKPSASELTVHTKGNLEALRQQQLQKNFIPKKEGLAFEYKLLLGHVSLLTDLTIAEVEADAGTRQYLLTADRDEHIRVSRGITQAHVIENYCLGHKEFVSKLCILPWQPSTLIAGSGEPSLKVYDWQRGVLKTDLLSLKQILADIKKCTPNLGLNTDRSVDNLAVSGIWPLQTSDTQGYVLIALEGLPCLLTYFHDGTAFWRCMTTPATGNILDVAVIAERRAILVSVDTAHRMGSMKIVEGPLRQQLAIYCIEVSEAAYQIATGQDVVQKGKLQDLNIWIRSDYTEIIEGSLAGKPHMGTIDLTGEDSQQHKPRKIYSKLGEFLYGGLENLRKRRDQEEIGIDEVVAHANGAAAEDENVDDGE